MSHLPAAWQCERHTAPDGVVRLVLQGELDLEHAASFDDELSAALADASTVLVDLAALDFMDSSGIHVLMAARERAQATGTRLLLVRPPERVHRLFELTGTTTAFQFVAGNGHA